MPFVHRFILVGAGHWGNAILRTLESLSEDSESPGFAWIVEKNAKRARQVVEKRMDRRSMLHDLDALPVHVPMIVATPTPTHKEFAWRAIRSGRPVWIEKPLTDSAESANEIALASFRSNVLSMTGHLALFDAGFRHLTRKIRDSGSSISRLRTMRSSGSVLGSERSVFFDLGCHEMYLIAHFCEQIRPNRKFSLVSKSRPFFEGEELVARGFARCGLEEFPFEWQYRFHDFTNSGARSFWIVETEDGVKRSWISSPGSSFSEEVPGKAPETIWFSERPLTEQARFFFRTLASGRLRGDPPNTLQDGANVVRMTSEFLERPPGTSILSDSIVDDEKFSESNYAQHA